MSRLNTFFVLTVGLLYLCPIYSTVYGDYSFVSRFPASLYFPADDSDNLVRGFSQLQQGIVLENSNTTGSVEVFFPILGDISLNGGTLYLNRNQVLGSDGILAGGAIDGNGYSLRYTTTGQIHLPKQQSFVSGTFLNLIQEDDVGASPVYVDWSFDDRYVCVGLSDGTVSVYSFDGTTLTQIQSTSMTNIGTLYDVRWQPGSYYFVAVGEGGTDQVEVFQFDPSGGTITSRVTDSPGVAVRACAWHESGEYLVTFRNANPEIQMYSFTPPATLTAGPTFDLSTRVDVKPNSIAWDLTGQYFAAALQTSSSPLNSELSVFSFNGTTSTITQEVAATVFGISYGLDWSQKNGYISIGLWDKGSLSDYNTLPQVVIDCKGNVISVWQDNDTGDIYAARSSSPGNWDAAQVISTHGGTNVRPQIAVDCSGNVICVWWDSSDRHTYIARYNALTGQWLSDRQISSEATPSGQDQAAQVAIDCEGNAMCVWGPILGADGDAWAAYFDAVPTPTGIEASGADITWDAVTSYTNAIDHYNVYCTPTVTSTVCCPSPCCTCKIRCCTCPCVGATKIGETDIAEFSITSTSCTGDVTICITAVDDQGNESPIPGSVQTNISP